MSLRGLSCVHGTDEECSELSVEVVGDVGVSCLLMTMRACFKRTQMVRLNHLSMYQLSCLQGFILDEELRTSIMNLSHVGGADEPVLHNTTRSVRIGDLINVASEKLFANIPLRNVCAIFIVPAKDGF